MKKALEEQQKFPRLSREEDVKYSVYYYTDETPIPQWIKTRTFDSLEDANERAEYLMKSERRIKKAIVVKEIYTVKPVCIVDTLKRREGTKDE